MQVMGTPSPPPTSLRLGRNVRQLRERRDNMSIRQLAAKLSDLLDRSFHPSGVVKIEKGARGVDADELLALALALGVTPNRLLLTGEVADDTVQLTRTVDVSQGSAWRWATGEQQLPGRSALPDRQFSAENRPHNPPGITTVAELRAKVATGRLDGLRREAAEARALGLGVSEIADLLGLWELDDVDRHVRPVESAKGGSGGER